MTRAYPETTGQQVDRPWRFGWTDAVVILAIIVFLWSLIVLGGDMRVRFDELHPPAISLDVALIPYYTARTVLRMFIAFAAALMFTFAYGYIAARSPRARTIMLPTLDILQSVPVLGFLSVTVTGFLALFPGSLLGVECASIFAIFTAQAWNMTFGFYHSLITVPAELQEAASVYGMNRWQRFTNVELPSSAIGLMWNSMMSFGGGWFFVAQSEAITVLNKNIKLPGLGSYMATAVEAGDTRAAVYAIFAMIATIVALDQLMWRPLVAWAEKFKLEQTESASSPTSWMLDLLRQSFVLAWLSDHVGKAMAKFSTQASETVSDLADAAFRHAPSAARRILRVSLSGLALTGIAWLAFDAVEIAKEIRTDMGAAEMLHVVWLGVLTLLRVVAMSVLATLDLDPDRRLDRAAAPRGPRGAAACPDRRVVSGQHDVPVHRGVLHRDPHSDQPRQHLPDGARDPVVHPVQRHRGHDGDSHGSARSGGNVRAPPLAPVEDADHPGHLPILGDRRSDSHRWRVECEHRRGGRDVGERQARRRRSGRLHCAGDRERRPAGDLLQHRGDGGIRGHDQPRFLAPAL